MTPQDSATNAHPPATEVGRKPDRASHDSAVLEQIIASAMVAHVGLMIDGWPYVVPVACAPWLGRTPHGLLLHGSTGGRLFRAMAAGTPVCATLSHLDGLVLARSAFNSSMNYRSAMVMGVAVELQGDAKVAAVAALTDHLLPGRRAEVRTSTSKELAATMVLGLAAEHWSVKIRTGDPVDPPEDLEESAEVWAGVVPLVPQFGAPEPDALAVDLPIPGYLASWSVPGAP